MKDFLVILKTIEDNIDNPKVLNLLPDVLIIICQLLLEIKNCDSYDKADTVFNTLQNIQELLSTLVFNKKIIIPLPLRKFVRDFERLDDPWLRNYLFNQIKKNTYSLYKNKKNK